MRRLPLVVALPALFGLAISRGLAADWVRYDTDRATVFFEDGALSPAEMARFSRLVDQGIGDIGAYLRTAAGPDGLRDGRITYRVGEAFPYSMTRHRTVFLPLERVRSDSAPYLHETVHVLVPTPHRSVWLSEGFASYVESYVSENVGGYDGHVFSRAGNRGVDAEAAAWLGRARGLAVLPYMGVAGEPPEMLWERRRVAAPFYVLSQSFSKFLVERLGLARVLALVSSRDPEASLERESGRAVDAWKADWLRSIGPPGLAAVPDKAVRAGGPKRLTSVQRRSRVTSPKPPQAVVRGTHWAHVAPTGRIRAAAR